MKKHLWLYLLLLAATIRKPAAAQGTTTLNHMALYVVDLQKSSDFYRNVLQLPELPEPFKDGRHAWFRLGPHSQLHIRKGKLSPALYCVGIATGFVSTWIAGACYVAVALIWLAPDPRIERALQAAQHDPS